MAESLGACASASSDASEFQAIPIAKRFRITRIEHILENNFYYISDSYVSQISLNGVLQTAKSLNREELEANGVPYILLYTKLGYFRLSDLQFEECTETFQAPEFSSN